MGAPDSPAALPPAVSAPVEHLEVEHREGATGRLAYYRQPGPGDGGAPVVLVHSINAAASAFEMRPIFEHLRGRRPVYMPDLPGYGLSERPAWRYDARVFTDAVHAIVEKASEAEGRPVSVVALSLSAEFVARAAAERPERFERLALITPTGFSRGSEKLREPGKTREVKAVSLVLEGRPWSLFLFGLLTREPSVRYFLRRTFGAREVDEDLVAYDVKSAHMPGAHHAPLAFLSGRLFSRDIRDVYEQLELPVWVPHGTRGDFADFSESAWAEARGNWSFEPFASGALPHYQVPAAFMASLDAFLEIE